MKKLILLAVMALAAFAGRAQCPITVTGNTVTCPGQTSTYTFTSPATSYTLHPYNMYFTSSTLQLSAYTTTTFTVIGTNGTCTDSAVFTINVNPSPSSVLSYTNASCTGGCNGALSASATGGTAPYSYNWNPLGVTTAGVQNVCAGMYSCLVTDQNGCTDLDTVYIQSSNPTIYTSVVPAACGQANGSITVDSISGGSTYFMCSLNGGSYMFNNSFINLTAGNYTIAVQDSMSGCNGSAVVSVNNSNFGVQFNPVTPGCNVCNGSLATTITGGSGPYTYTWSTGAGTSSISGLCPGNYQVSVTDQNGCFSSNSYHLISLASPVVQINNIANVTCSGVTTGSVAVSATGGTAPYTYAWNTTPVQTTANATNLQVGYHLVTVTDNLGCATPQWVYVANASNIYLSSINTQLANCSNNGSISVIAGGGTPPYVFNWSNGATGSTVTGLATGVYTVTITDAGGCQDTGSINVPFQCYNLVKGRIYYDQNQNCIQDMGENGLGGFMLTDNNGHWGYTNQNGDYVFYTSSMTPTVTLTNYQFPYMSPTCPSTGSFTVGFTQLGDSSLGNNVGMWSNPNYVDLSIHPGFTTGHPGMNKDYWIYFKNTSLNTQNVLVRFTYDPILQFNSLNSGGVHYPAQHKIEWTFNNVAANKQWDFTNDPRAYFTVPSSTPINQNLTSFFEILPVSGDANPGDNTVSTVDPVTGSRDPNEKTVYPAGNITPADSVLTYYIHFQNNGNDTAYRVVVVDTLSSFLDPATIIPGASNHQYKFSLSGQGICTWTFDSIMLPDSLTNEPASNGYFSYTIKQKPGNTNGTQIKNTAYIYFDFNQAVVTNTTLNTVVTVGVPEIAGGSKASFVVYPNPAGDQLTVCYELYHAGTIALEIRNILGEVVKTQVMPNAQRGTHVFDVNTGGLKNGAYVIRVIDGAQERSQKLIIQR